MSIRSDALSEQAIQKAVFAHLRTRGALGIVAWHPFSGGYRRPAEAAIYKSLGVRAGLPDVMVLHWGKLFCLELKKVGGRQTEQQIECLGELAAAGAYTCVAYGLDAAIRCLESWGLFKGTEFNSDEWNRMWSCRFERASA